MDDAFDVDKDVRKKFFGSVFEENLIQLRRFSSTRFLSIKKKRTSPTVNLQYYTQDQTQMLHVLCAILIALPFSSAGGTVHWTVGNIIIDDPTIYFGLDIFSPTTPDSYPMIIFLTGLNGIAPMTAYTELLTTVAEQNIIVIALSKIGNIKPEKVAVHVGHFLDWVIKPDDGAARLFSEQKAVQGVIPNTTRLGFLSHSSAAHPLGQYLNGTCGPIKLIVMMNPVDGIDPWGRIDDFVTRKDKRSLFSKYMISFQILPLHFHFEHQHLSSVPVLV